MYKICIKDKKNNKIFRIAMSSEKEMLDELSGWLNDFFNRSVEDANGKISLRGFLSLDSNTYYLMKVLDSSVPGFGAMIMFETIKRLADKRDFALSKDMWVVKRTVRKKYNTDYNMF